VNHPARQFLASLAIAFAFGCSSDPVGPTVQEQYSLVSIDDQTLPYFVSQILDERRDITVGRIKLFADGTYEDRTTFRTSRASVVSTADATIFGTWDREGDTIFFTVDDDDDNPANDNYTGTVSGQTLTISLVTKVWRYTKS
jgi:hypothetical protein